MASEVMFVSQRTVQRESAKHFCSELEAAGV